MGWVFLIFLAVVGFGAVGIYNSLVGLRQKVKAAWAQIDVQLKRRYDLIPNLVETVKGYAKHERETLEAVIQARNAAVSAKGVKEQGQAENQLTGALRQLFVLVERYPDLKANQNFLALQEELATTENRISFARQHYNDITATFNTRLQSFPANILAGFFGFKEASFFEIDEEAQREAPKVEF